MSASSSSNSSKNERSQRLNFLPQKPRESDVLTLDFPHSSSSLLRSAAVDSAPYEADDLYRDAEVFPSKGLSYHSSMASPSSHYGGLSKKRSHDSFSSGGLYSSIDLSPSPLQFPSGKSAAPSSFEGISVPSRPAFAPSQSTPVPSTSSLMQDPEWKRMFIDEAPTGVIIDIAPEEPSSGDDSVMPSLPTDYERASSVSCKSNDDLLRSTIEKELTRLRCDIRESSSSWKVQGTAFYLSDSVEFRINTYRNPEYHKCSLTVEVNRFSGRSDVFSRFFADIVECLSKADLLCDASSEYPKGQFNCGANDVVVDEVSVHGSSVNSAKRRHISSSGDDEKQFDAVPRRPGFAPRGASQPAAMLDFSGMPPKPAFPPKRAFSVVPPRRPMDLQLSRNCVMNLLEPFRTSSSPEEKRAAAITLARACDNTEGRKYLMDDEILSILEQMLGANDKELVRSGTIVLCRLFEWSDLSRSRVSQLWDRFHPIVIERRQAFAYFDSPDLDRYVARMLAASLASGMSCAELKGHLSRSPNWTGLKDFLKRMATSHSCKQVQSHSKRALNHLKSCEGARSAAAC